MCFECLTNISSVELLLYVSMPFLSSQGELKCKISLLISFNGSNVLLWSFKMYRKSLSSVRSHIAGLGVFLVICVLTYLSFSSSDEKPSSNPKKKFMANDLRNMHEILSKNMYKIRQRVSLPHDAGGVYQSSVFSTFSHFCFKSNMI